jgi:exodeoxyribonuclease V alpha subunit
MSDVSVRLRVTSIGEFPSGGGVIFRGISEDKKLYCVLCNYKLVPSPSLVVKGQSWLVAGPGKATERVTDSGFRLRETTITATAATLTQPADENLIEWIAKRTDAKGVGPVKAKTLCERFGAALRAHLERKNIEALSEVISSDAAQVLCNAYMTDNVGATLIWLDQVPIEHRLGMKIVDFYKGDARAKIKANPYVLTPFAVDWEVVDSLATNRLNVPLDDPRRLEGAVEEALYRGMKKGHTCLPEQEVRVRLRRLLKDDLVLVDKALISGHTTQYREIDGFCQAEGLYKIESYIATRLLEMVAGEERRGQTGLFSQLIHTPTPVGQVIREYEVEQGQRLKSPFMLNTEQRTAIHICTGNELSLILGGAGTGKTTTLQCLYRVLRAQCPGVDIYQLALAGLASNRMKEATGHEAMTIAAFLARFETSDIAIGSVIVVDEASMLDILLMYRLLQRLPQGVRLVLVGDPPQLPPIGPGLVLHALAGNPIIPQTTLVEVKRQSQESGIPKVADAIRKHESPRWDEYHGTPVQKTPKARMQTGLFDRGVQFIRCGSEDLDATTIKIYEELGGSGLDHSVQVLAVLKNGKGGSHNLNQLMHEKYRKTSKAVMYRANQLGPVCATTLRRVPLCVGDLLMFTENDYELDLRNGSLGRIVEALTVGAVDEPCCSVEFAGRSYLFNSTQLERVAHAYALTVHKGQGSQFNTVVLPVRKSNLLDHSMIYTAITRGVQQVVLIGDHDAAMAAIQRPANATHRHVTLPRLLAKGTNTSALL